MRQRVLHGGVIDAATTEDVRSILETIKPPQKARIRAPMNIRLDGSGDGQDEVYTVPLGYTFSLRRLVLNISTATSPVDGQVPLNVGSRYVALLRTGVLVEYPVLVSPTGISQVPGYTSWGSDEEPWFRNGEKVEIQAVGMTPNAILIVMVEGLLKEDEHDMWG